MKKIDRFTNQYAISKTLRFKLIPEGKTAENFDTNLMLETDEKRAEDYVVVKGLIDRYHKVFIDRALNAKTLNNINDYAELYLKSSRSAEDNKKLAEISAKMRKEISAWFTKDPNYNGLFGADIITDTLPAFLTDEEEKQMVEKFAKFTVYFTGFHENRRNLYSGEGKSTEIAFRIIDQNLPKYLDNCRTAQKAFAILSEADINELANNIAEALSTDIHGIKDPLHFNSAMSQSGIDIYNQIIGGYTKENGEKVKGFNEYINLYNQTHIDRLPKFKPLFKQILSDRSSISFIPEAFKTDDEVLQCIYAFFNNEDTELHITGKTAIKELCNLLSDISRYDLGGIFVPNGAAITELSNGTFGSWDIIRRGFEAEYDNINMQKPPKDMDKYLEKRSKLFKTIKSYSIVELQNAAVYSGIELRDNSVAGYISSKAESLYTDIIKAYDDISALISEPYPESRSLISADEDIELIKTLLDSVMSLLHFAKLLCGCGDEENKDELFYGDFSINCEQLESVVPLYNKVRNYVTRKPYSDSKIKLNFDNPQFLGGWDQNKERDYSAVLLTKNGQYYLAVMAKDFRKSFETIPDAKSGEEVYSKMIYKLLSQPHMSIPKAFFSKKGIQVFNPPQEIITKYNMGAHKAGSTFNIQDCHDIIDFFKDAISRHEDWSKFGFEFSPTADYKSIADFYREVEAQGYKITFQDVPVSYIDRLVSEGKLYLFRLYNKDFSQNSKGTPNLHTLYFKMLFDEANLADPSFRLNGGAEMFYRKASIKHENAVIHKANQPIANKNPDNLKKESVFDYDIIKDRRYTERQFEIHIPTKMNAQASGYVNINDEVRKALHDCPENYVIGIDRGERNLLYVCVIDGCGKIVEQFSLNDIINEYNGCVYKTDYHKLLDSAEKSRLKARQDWKTINNISNIKEGYISQAVHKICELVEKYDAVIAMEDLNGGFKNSRVHVEKSVYQKFEKMLIDKLNFMADKHKSPDEVGGLLNAYQLTSKFESFAKMGRQNGFIFYIPAWLTSKIDPTTGFVNLLNTRFKSVAAAKEFFEGIDAIRYNAENDWFEFDIDYNNFPKCNADFKKQWTLTTHGKRVKTFRNPEKNSEWDNISIDLTSEFKALFSNYGINYSKGDLKSGITARNEKEFYVSIMKLMSLMLQMRNSITGTNVDYLISPVINNSGTFFCSDNAEDGLPFDADANGAFNIARKAQWAIRQIQNYKGENLREVNISITNAAWLEYAQKTV